MEQLICQAETSIMQRQCCLQQIFTTRQLVKHLDETQLSHNTTNIIMIGTNDIRLNNAKDAIDNIKKIKNNIPPNTIIANIPPLNIDCGDEEMNEEVTEGRIRYNKEINATYQTTIKTNSLNKYMRENPTTILNKDGFHLNEEGAYQLAQEWINIIENPTHNTPKEETTDTITIERHIAPHVVGREGKHLKALKDKYHVKLSTSNDTHENLIITISGARSDIKQAKQEITKTTETQKENERELQDQQKKHTGKICRDYKRTGQCHRGRKCWFSHEPAETTPTNTDNTRDQDRRRVDRRTRTPERDEWQVKRRRDISRGRKPHTPERHTRTYNERSRTRSPRRDRRRSPSRH